jgi:predicted Ser/Thr protein kinase/tetratricopeptide (TPR) repeat protein
MAEGEGKSVDEPVGPLDRTIEDTVPAAPGRQLSGGLPHGTTIRRYVVVDEVGAGAMGVVYAAYDYGLDRRVALKLLRDPRPGAARKRLLREAQALAKLSHPGVIAVYDVGTHRDQVFVAMEFVEGVTLRQWLENEPRTWREVVEVFRRAGEGLAAAHAAGIVHRDFKPDNVLIDRRGRVRVGDFGLALVDRDEEASGADTPVPDAPEPNRPAPDAAGSLLEATVTATGIVLGTPAYMAPEQHAGARAIDARADQFAFCVALYEGLYGERPFAGESELALYEQIAAGTVREVPRGRGRCVPAWLRAVILRGLAFEPAGRHAGMEALLDELRRPRALRRRRVWTAVIALTVAGAAIAGGAASGLLAADVNPCAGAAAPLASVWDEPTRRAVEQAFAWSGARDAAQQWNAFAAGLDRYSAAWTAMRTDSCEATHVRGEQSQELLDLRSACLDRRLGELGALVDLYRRPDPAMVSHATAAGANLSSLEACANAAALGEERPPRDRTAGRALREEIGRARASLLAGRSREALASAEAAARRARAGGDRAAEAAALVTVASSRRALDDLEAAEEAAYGALSAAEAARSGEAAVDGWLELIHVLSASGNRREEARRMARLAQAALERVGATPRLEARIEEWHGVLAMDRGALDEAQPHLERALVLRERRGRAGHGSDVTRSIHQLASLEDRRGHHERALALHRRARASAEAQLAADHPGMVPLLVAEAACLRALRRFDEARRLLERTLALADRVMNPDDPERASVLEEVAQLHIAAARPGQALEPLERAVAIRADAAVQPRARARGEFLLARLLVDLGGDRARALQLASECAIALDHAGDQALRDEVRDWIGKIRRAN